MPRRLILDTDIGTDVDDCLALAVLLGSSEIELIGVTTVYGDVMLRARMIGRLLELAGRPDIPVMLGVGETLRGGRDIYWPGHEGVGLLEDADPAWRPDDRHGVDFIIDTVMASPGDVHLLAIGPLTNVALAVRREPRLLGALEGLTIMGGAARGPARFQLPYAEHNIRCDPEAAAVVLAQPTMKRLVPLDVTTRVRIRPHDLLAIRRGGSPFHDAVARLVELYPPFAANGQTALHDPLAALIVTDPDLVTGEEVMIDVETAGRFGEGVTFVRKPGHDEEPSTRIALDVRVRDAETGIIERISRPLATSAAKAD